MESAEFLISHPQQIILEHQPLQDTVFPHRYIIFAHRELTV